MSGRSEKIHLSASAVTNLREISVLDLKSQKAFLSVLLFKQVRSVGASGASKRQNRKQNVCCCCGVP